MTIDEQRVRRESVRWHVLLVLSNARPIGSYEEPILSVVQAVYPDASPLELRQAMDYLDTRGLIVIDRQPHGRWHARLTRYGIDLAEYTCDCEPGIARPAKYW